MIKLSLAKKFGIELVAGDVFEGISIRQKLVKILNEYEDCREICIESFTPRLISDGIPTSIDGDVVLELTNGKGLVSFLSARNAAWHVWTTWCPSMEWLVQQAADKPVTYKDDTQHFGEDVLKVPSDSDCFTSRCVVMPVSIEPFQDGYSVGYKLPPESTVSPEPVKPTFTQAMADAGELPTAGSMVKVCLADAGFHVDGYDERFESKICLVAASFINKYGSKMVVISNDLGEHGCYVVKSIKPLDTRTEKEKAVDAAMISIGCHPSQDFIKGAPYIIGMMFDAGLLK